MTKNKLVKIEPAPIPPLRQSTETVMACPEGYVEVFIKGRKKPGGVDSVRGTQVHDVWGKYAALCAFNEVEQDLPAFDHLAKGAGPQATKILSGIRDTWRVDYAHFFAAEVPMALDAEMCPTMLSESMRGIAKDSGAPEIYQGTLDAIYIFRAESKIEINDAKTHVKPFEPSDTLQGKEYSVFIFQHFPWVQVVVFKLVFVRYKNLIREVTYTRDQLPSLIEELKSARARQEKIHKDYEEGNDIEVASGPQCMYCPKLSDRSYSIGQYNENMQLTPVEWMKWDLWNAAFSRVNKARMKAFVEAHNKPIVLKDYNGKIYQFGPQEKESLVYPLFKRDQRGLLRDHLGRPVMPIVELLIDHADTFPEDTDWLPNIVISSTKLSNYLGAKKRVLLDNAINDTADKVTKVSLRMSKPLEKLEDEEPEEEYGEEFDDEGEL